MVLTAPPAPEPVTRAALPAAAPPAPLPVASPGLEARLERIVRSHEGRYGVAVYDPASGTTASVASDRTFYAASLAKLPALYSLYRAADAGELGLEEPIYILPTDVQPYGSGVLATYPVGYEMTLRECAEYLMQESDNTAWVMLDRRLGAGRIQGDLASLGAGGTDYAALETTPDDVLLVLRAISDPSLTSRSLSDDMLATMTDTAYEDRIPAALPPDVRVAHKVGTFGDTYGDAGVVFGEGGRYYIVVIAEDTTEAEARSAMRRISLAAYEALG